jgi:hypothetical protein
MGFDMQSKAAHSLIQHLADLAAREDVWLVCMEKEYPCHRFLVKEVIERMLVARGVLEMTCPHNMYQFSS